MIALEAAQGDNKIIKNAEADWPRLGTSTAWRSSYRRTVHPAQARQGARREEPAAGWLQVDRHDQADVPWGPSTVRAELPGSRTPGCSSTRTPRRAECRPTAAIASTSTSCSPRGAGCRCRASAWSCTAMRREVDEAMRATTEQLSQVTDLLALVAAPPIETATIQPRRGAAAPAAGRDGGDLHLHRRGDQAGHLLEEPVEPGVVAWAASYLNEALGKRGRGGSRMALARSSTTQAGPGESATSWGRWRPPWPRSSSSRRSTTCSMEGAAPGCC